jgi:hypothetical protein
MIFFCLKLISNSPLSFAIGLLEVEEVEEAELLLFARKLVFKDNFSLVVYFANIPGRLNDHGSKLDCDSSIVFCW